MITKLTSEQSKELETIAEMLHEWNRMSLRSDDPRKSEIFLIVEDLQQMALNQPLRRYGNLG